MIAAPLRATLKNVRVVMLGEQSHGGGSTFTGSASADFLPAGLQAFATRDEWSRVAPVLRALAEDSTPAARQPRLALDDPHGVRRLPHRAGCGGR